MKIKIKINNEVFELLQGEDTIIMENRIHEVIDKYREMGTILKSSPLSFADFVKALKDFMYHLWMIPDFQIRIVDIHYWYIVDIKNKVAIKFDGI